MKILHVNKFFPFAISQNAGNAPSRPYPYGGTEHNMLVAMDVFKKHGHEVMAFSMKHPDGIRAEFNDYFVSYSDFDMDNFAQKMKLAGNILYSLEAKKKLGQLLDDHPVDIVHLHNFHHQISPSILSELRKRNIPTVMTLNDYKMVCPSYRLLNHGRICELCKDGKFYNAAGTKCLKGSFVSSSIVALESYLHHGILNNYKDIKYYICASKFIMNKVQEMGLRGRFVNIPYPVDPARFEPYRREGKDIKNGIYWGRLSPEKGVDTLVDAVKTLPIDFKIIGDGPIRTRVEEHIKEGGINNIRMLSGMYGEKLLSEISKSAFLVVPSEWYEVSGIVIIEAFSLGMPVIGAKIGGIPELVKDGETGFLFEPGNVDDLRGRIKELISDPVRAFKMGKNGQAVAVKEHNPEIYYQRLMEVYNNAIGS